MSEAAKISQEENKKTVGLPQIIKKVKSKEHFAEIFGRNLNCFIPKSGFDSFFMSGVVAQTKALPKNITFEKIDDLPRIAELSTKYIYYAVILPTPPLRRFFPDFNISQSTELLAEKDLIQNMVIHPNNMFKLLTKKILDKLPIPKFDRDYMYAVLAYVAPGFLYAAKEMGEGKYGTEGEGNGVDMDGEINKNINYDLGKRNKTNARMAAAVAKRLERLELLKSASDKEDAEKKMKEMKAKEIERDAEEKHKDTLLAIMLCFYTTRNTTKDVMLCGSLIRTSEEDVFKKNSDGVLLKGIYF